MRLFSILIFIFQVNACLGQANTLNIIDNPNKRLRCVTHYTSKYLDIPQQINDSTVNLINKDVYYYNDDNKLIKIVTTFYGPYAGFHAKTPTVTRIDSITYLNQDSIFTTHVNIEKGNKTIWESKEKLIDFKGLLTNLPNRGMTKFNYLDPNGKQGNTTLKTRNGLITNIEYKSPDYSGKFKILYSEQAKVKQVGKCHFQYSGNRDFIISNFSGALSSELYFYFDNDGFLNKQISQTDTNPDIRIYEYETGKGNVTNFIYSIYDAWSLTPFIY
jgi:hypothetical protein